MVTAGAPFTPPHSTLARAAPCALHPSPFHSCQSRALRPHPISSIFRHVWDHEIVQGGGRPPSAPRRGHWHALRRACLPQGLNSNRLRPPP